MSAPAVLDVSKLTDEWVERFWPGADPEAIRQQMSDMIAEINAAEPDVYGHCEICTAPMPAPARPNTERRFCDHRCRSAYHTACNRLGDHLIRQQLVSLDTLRRFSPDPAINSLASAGSVDAPHSDEVGTSEGLTA